jgi:hypothetical protein
MNAYVLVLGAVALVATCIVGVLIGRHSMRQTTAVPCAPCAQVVCATPTETTKKTEGTKRRVKTVVQTDAGYVETTEVTRTEDVHIVGKAVDVPTVRTLPQDPPPMAPLVLKPEWRVSAKAGVEFGSGEFVWGGEVSRRCLGPIECGVWGLSNGTGGVSLGVTW